jgi:glycosyltransferase involved in cell wall biosynthesis
MPSVTTLHTLERIKLLQPMTQRLGRRHFSPLARVPKIQGRAGELRRLLLRAFGCGNDRLSDQANDWLMRTMTHECRRSSVTAIHAYEDCSLWQFVEAKRSGKACIYDMPIGYYPAWEQTEKALTKKYADWLSTGEASHQVRLEQKCKEMKLADLVLVPSDFAANTVRELHGDKSIAIARYGVDLTSWTTPSVRATRDVITFLFAGQCSLRKGVPLLLEAWRAADLRHARLQLVGPWQLAADKKKQLAPGCEWTGPVSSQQLRSFYQHADVFVFPTNFEGRALVVGEALASGLPVITTHASGADDIVNDSCGRVVASDNLDDLVEALRWFQQNRDRLTQLSCAARFQAERSTWDRYRRQVTEAVTPYV